MVALVGVEECRTAPSILPTVFSQRTPFPEARPSGLNPDSWFKVHGVDASNYRQFCRSRDRILKTYGLSVRENRHNPQSIRVWKTVSHTHRTDE